PVPYTTLFRSVGADSGLGLHHLGERPVRHAFAVRERASCEDCDAFDTGKELADEPALADARLAVDGEDVRTPVAKCPLERVLEQLELRLAADERRRDARDRKAAVEGGERTVRRKRMSTAS